MAYQVLYQKYRPKNLDQLCGQDHIVRTLRNAIKNNRIGNAYLFTGIHGTGKTTVSRILACMINCVNGPTDTPCGECENCRKIHTGIAADVIEIDAASNGGIDKIRFLRDKARYAPSEMREKFFLIDEAHQLSQEASNALLKILEEPPANLHFCLCTTEPRSIIATIKSRCQHFAIRKIHQKKIFEYLVPIIKAENIQIDKDALKMVVQIADGSMRNALKSLESLWNFGGTEKVTVQNVSDVLSVADTKKSYELIDCIIKNDIANGIRLINEITVNGIDLTNLLSNLIEHLRNILVLLTCKDTSLVDASEEEMIRLQEQSRAFSIKKAIAIFELFESLQKTSYTNISIQNTLEVCLFRASFIFNFKEN